jgi:DNA-binding Lrp family transcriptional regulator
MRNAEKRELAIEQEVLKILSMNARASFNFIGNRIGTSAQQAYRIVKKLEKKYGIKYLAEIDVEKLGYIKFLVLAKFSGDIPTEKEVKEIFDKDPRIQMGMMLAGRSYDLLFYVLVQNNEEIDELRRELTSNSPLRNYNMILYLTPFYQSYNFVPLRDEFIDTLKERILSLRTKKNYPISREKQQNMLKREFAILKEWNLDGSTDLRDIDRKYGFEKGRAQYAYYRLLESGLIKRLTITMTNLSIKYISVFSLKIFNYEAFYKTRKRLFEDIISETSTPTNRYLLVGDIGSPFSGLLFLPVFGENDIEVRNEMAKKIRGTRVRIHTTTKIFGRVCLRKFDNAYAMQTETLSKNYGVPTTPKENYLEN